MNKGFFKINLIYFFILFIVFAQIEAVTITFYAKAPVSLSDLSSVFSDIFSEGMVKSLKSAFNDFPSSGSLNSSKGLESTQDAEQNNNSFLNGLEKQNLQDSTCWGLKQIDYCKEMLSV